MIMMIVAVVVDMAMGTATTTLAIYNCGVDGGDGDEGGTGGGDDD